MKHVHDRFAYVPLLCLVLLILSCSKGEHSHRRLTAAEQIWIKAEYHDRTNEVHSAFVALLRARDKLTAMKRRGDKGLEYNYCLAILNGRLMLMAKDLGDTNAADAFFEESAFYLNANREPSRIPITNFSPAMIELMIKRRDAKVHSDG